MILVQFQLEASWGKKSKPHLNEVKLPGLAWHLFRENEDRKPQMIPALHQNPEKRRQ